MRNLKDLRLHLSKHSGDLPSRVLVGAKSSAGKEDLGRFKEGGPREWAERGHTLKSAWGGGESEGDAVSKRGGSPEGVL